MKSILDFPRPYISEQEIHKACRKGDIDQISAIITSNHKLINIKDDKVNSN